jgi:hypothetical protein
MARKTVQELTATSLPAVGTDLVPVARSTSPATKLALSALPVSDAAQTALDARALRVANLAALVLLAGTSGASVVMAGRNTPGDGGGGTFAWTTGDQSANITADPTGGVWVAPDSDPTGASGAFQRIFDGPINVRWFGVVTTATRPASSVETANAAAINAAVAYGHLSGNTWLLLPQGNIYYNAPIIFEPQGSDTYTRGWRIDGQSPWADTPIGTIMHYYGTDIKGGLQLKSVFGFSSDGISWRPRVNGLDCMIYIWSGNAPLFTSSQITFRNFQISPGGSVTVAKGLLWAVDTSTLRLIDFLIGGGAARGNAIYYGDTRANRPSTLLRGAVVTVEHINGTFTNGHCDIATDQIEGWTNTNCAGGTGGGMRVHPVGEGLQAQVTWRGCRWVNEDPNGYPCITQGTYAGTGVLERTWGHSFEGCRWRERPSLIQVNFGGVYFGGGNVANVRAPDSGGYTPIGLSIEDAAVGPVMGTGNIDFSKAYGNGFYAVVDNRTGGCEDFYICDQQAAADSTLSAVGSYANVVDTTTSQPFLGGQIEVNGEVGILNNDASARGFNVKTLFDSTLIDLQTVTIPAGAYATVKISKAVRQPGKTATPGVATGNSAVQVQVQQSAGTAATIAGLSGTTGRTFVQVKLAS